MIKFLHKKNNYDFIHQFQWIKSNNNTSFNVLYIDCNNNKIINNKNIIYPTYYSFLLLFNQKPLIKKTNKSISSFNVRPNMNLGLFLSINNKSLVWNNIFYFINSKLPLHYNNNNISSNFKNNVYNIQINYGIENINDKVIAINHFNFINNGANFTFKFKSPVNFKPFFYLPS